ncbi:sulfotransferase, partial [Pseudomonas sp.]|uniref:sulfotransferase n=1 Tax=Pseudomonas sp. TaxID=306 RepID=UPI00356726A5
MPTFHFISGLPRSGSTLLAALLRQNPRFHAGMTSPVGSLFSALLGQFSAGSEFGPVITQEQRKRLLAGLFSNYYAEQAGKDIVFDTNRQWCAKLPALMDLFPQAKVIACVRNVAWVMDSLERLYRANPYENTKLFGDDVERNTVYSRVETLAQRNRLVGFAWAALKDAYYGEHA